MHRNTQRPRPQSTKRSQMLSAQGASVDRPQTEIHIMLRQLRSGFLLCQTIRSARISKLKLVPVLTEGGEHMRPQLGCILKPSRRWDFSFISFHLDHPLNSYFHSLRKNNFQNFQTGCKLQLLAPNAAEATCATQRGASPVHQCFQESAGWGGGVGADGLEANKDPHIQLLIYYIKSYVFINHAV